MKEKLWLVLVLLFVLPLGVMFIGEQSKTQAPYSANPYSETPTAPTEQPAAPIVQDNGAEVLRAFQNRQSSVQVSGSAAVSRLLPDDNEGSRHQKFILQFSNGNTLLIAHNIDLAPRIASLQVGDHVEFYGVYEWNEKGGVVHWTHHDPAGRHIGGWLRHNDQTYQ